MSQTFKIQEQDALFELEVSELGDANTPGRDDVLFNVTVETGGYTAADQDWVVRSDLDRFLQQLRALDQNRQGKALLVSASPDDLQLEFYSTDSAGHMAVRGQLGRTEPNGFRLQLQFGFAFEPDKLPSVLEYFGTISRK
jgi:hypothetical protein